MIVSHNDTPINAGMDTLLQKRNGPIRGRDVLTPGGIVPVSP